MSKTTIILAACMVLASCGHESSAPSDQMISIGTHRLQLYREGKGTPAVVIDTGLADQLDKLKPLQACISRVTQVITYNRAGYGRSEAGPLPRDVGHEAEELNMQAFASKHPDDVAGMVLLDPPPLSFILGQEYKDLVPMAERMTAEWQAIADSAAKSNAARDQARSTFFRMIASEHREMFGATARQVGGISTFGNIPLVVIAAGKPNPAFGEGAEEYQKYWIEQSRNLTAKSTKSKFILAEGSSHYLYLDVLDLVAKSIISVVNEVRAKNK